MGLRDYVWLEDVLPARCGATDIDMVVEQHSTGRVAMLEFKPTKYVPRGQGMAFDTFVRLGVDLYIVVDRNADKDEYLVGQWVRDVTPQGGAVVNWYTMSLTELRVMMAAWWNAGIN